MDDADKVVAIDSASGRVSHSGSEPFSYEANPIPGTGCVDQNVVYDNTIGGGRIDLESVVAPMNECGMEVESIVCGFNNGTSTTVVTSPADAETLACHELCDRFVVDLSGKKLKPRKKGS